MENKIKKYFHNENIKSYNLLNEMKFEAKNIMS